MTIFLFTPALLNNSGKESSNLGDLMIHESIIRELANLFPKTEIVSISSHSRLPKKEFTLKSHDLCFVGGSNLLSSNMNQYAQWKINLFDSLHINNVILFGVGWWQYQKKPNFYTKLLLNRVLSGGFLHSLRDEYTLKKLNSIGIKNTINTSCPTMWPFLKFNFEQIPQRKSRNALVMLTDYKKAPISDKKLLNLLSFYYDEIFFWPQGENDLDYFYKLEVRFPVKILERSLKALDQLLKSDIEFDYIGTRLHGGIRCILNNRRSIIIEVDNRTKEIARDTGLPSIDRKELDKIKIWITTSQYTNIILDKKAIEFWKDQFK